MGFCPFHDGATVDRVVVDLSQEKGICKIHTFIMSRVKRLKDLYILNMNFYGFR